MTKKDGSVELKEFAYFNDDFGNFIANSDLEAYNQVIKLTLDSKFKSMFGFWIQFVILTLNNKIEAKIIYFIWRFTIKRCLQMQSLSRGL